MDNFFTDVSNLMTKHNQNNILIFVSSPFYDELISLKEEVIAKPNYTYELYSNDNPIGNAFLSKNNYFQVNHLGKSFIIFNQKDFGVALKELK